MLVHHGVARGATEEDWTESAYASATTMGFAPVCIEEFQPWVSHIAFSFASLLGAITVRSP